MKTQPPKPCACGCGEKLRPNSGAAYRYGHHMRGKRSCRDEVLALVTERSPACLAGRQGRLF